MLELAIFAVALIATIGGIAVFKRIGLSKRLLDVPNERSSHETPTPKGGGLIVVTVCLLLYIVAATVGNSTIRWSYIVGAVLIAVVSWLDDVYDLSAFIRLIVHGIAAVVVILGCGAITTIYVPIVGSPIELGWIGQVITFVWIVWLINAYNFMDGIDGIAGIQAVVAGIAWAVCGYLVEDNTLYLFGGVIAFSSLGFLVHNWPPASIFLGDVGSAFLGFTFACMPLLFGSTGSVAASWLAVATLAFTWIFVVDAVLTFIRRSLKGEKVWIAHRQHLYQQLVIGGWSHGSVSLLYGTVGSLVAAAFFTAFAFRGNWEALLVFVLVGSAGLVAVLASRKKV